MGRAAFMISLASAALLTATQVRSDTLASSPAQLRVGLSTINAAKLKLDLAFIASDALAGRMSLQPGDDMASAWIAAEFAKAGLQPAFAGLNGRVGYLQPVPLIEFGPDAAASAFVVKHGKKTTSFSAPDVIGGYKRAVTVSGPVIFAGYGITAPELGYDDYAGIDVRGKIVLVFDHEPQENDPGSIFNGTANTRYATSQVKAMAAQSHGALAILVVPEPNRTHLTNDERFKRAFAGLPPRATPIPEQSLENDEINIPILSVSDSVAAELMSTSGATPKAAQSAIDAALQPQSAMLPGISVSIRLRNSFERTGLAQNVVGLLPGSDPKLSAETIIFSAHHDHDGMAACADPHHPPVTDPPDPKPCPMIWRGADDNGSGTVGIVALARAFAANPTKPKRSILFVVFAAEERGLLGSYWMAAHPLRPLETTRAMINFDMIGRDEAPSPQTDGVIKIPPDTTNRLNLIGARYSPDYDHVVADVNRSVGLTLDYRYDQDSTLDILFRSDQFPFVLHDIPAFWWFTGFHPDYHHTTDTVEKINFAKMVKILDLAYLTGWRFADDATTPRFIANAGMKASN